MVVGVLDVDAFAAHAGEQAMKTRPYNATSEQVRAHLYGRLKQLWVPCKEQPTSAHGIVEKPTLWCGDERSWFICLVEHDWWFGHCPLGVPGDGLVVKETWRRGIPSRPEWRAATLYYQVDDVFRDVRDLDAPQVQRWWDQTRSPFNGHQWKAWLERRCSPVTMPRWASRITLEVTDVEVRRVQSITDEEAIAAGCIDGGCTSCGESSHPGPCGCDDPSPNYVDDFAGKWIARHGWIAGHGKRYPWHSNPWAWCASVK